MVGKITIIGGAGFIGTNLCRLLTENQCDFEIIDLKESRQFPEKCKIGDIRKIESLRELITGDVVVHLAAVHRDDVRDLSEYERTNVTGTQNIATVCSEKGIKKIVFTSSVAVYGFAAPGTDEGGEIRPFNEYGRTKFEAEEVLRKWRDLDDNSLIVVRPTVVFGEGNRGNVYNLLYQIASGRFVMIGNGKNKKSMAYVGNIVSFLHACVNSEKNAALYNYIDTPDLTMNELVSLVRDKLKGKKGVGTRLPYWLGLILGYIADFAAKILRRNLPISSIRVKKFASSTEFQSAKHTLDGFEPPYELKEGIQRTLTSEFLTPDPGREIFYSE